MISFVLGRCARATSNKQREEEKRKREREEKSLSLADGGRQMANEEERERGLERERGRITRIGGGPDWTVIRWISGRNTTRYPIEAGWW